MRYVQPTLLRPLGPPWHLVCARAGPGTLDPTPPAHGITRSKRGVSRCVFLGHIFTAFDIVDIVDTVFVSFVSRYNVCCVGVSHTYCFFFIFVCVDIVDAGRFLDMLHVIDFLIGSICLLRHPSSFFLLFHVTTASLCFCYGAVLAVWCCIILFC